MYLIGSFIFLFAQSSNPTSILFPAQMDLISPQVLMCFPSTKSYSPHPPLLPPCLQKQMILPAPGHWRVSHPSPADKYF